VKHTNVEIKAVKANRLRKVNRKRRKDPPVREERRRSWVWNNSGDGGGGWFRKEEDLLRCSCCCWDRDHLFNSRRFQRLPSFLPTVANRFSLLVLVGTPMVERDELELEFIETLMVGLVMFDEKHIRPALPPPPSSL